jgi:hypothetical protein
MEGFDRDLLDRFYQRGLTVTRSTKRNEEKSVIVTDEGLRESERLFNLHFVVSAPNET